MPPTVLTSHDGRFSQGVAQAKVTRIEPSHYIMMLIKYGRQCGPRRLAINGADWSSHCLAVQVEKPLAAKLSSTVKDTRKH